MAIGKENELFENIENTFISIDESVNSILNDGQKFISIANNIQLKLTISNYGANLNEARDDLLNKSYIDLVNKLRSTNESYLKCVKILKHAKSKNIIEETIFDFIRESKINLLRLVQYEKSERLATIDFGDLKLKPELTIEKFVKYFEYLRNSQRYEINLTKLLNGPNVTNQKIDQIIFISTKIFLIHLKLNNKCDQIQVFNDGKVFTQLIAITKEFVQIKVSKRRIYVLHHFQLPILSVYDFELNLIKSIKFNRNAYSFAINEKINERQLQQAEIAIHFFNNFQIYDFNLNSINVKHEICPLSSQVATLVGLSHKELFLYSNIYHLIYIMSRENLNSFKKIDLNGICPIEYPLFYYSILIDCSNVLSVSNKFSNDVTGTKFKENYLNLIDLKSGEIHSRNRMNILNFCSISKMSNGRFLINSARHFGPESKDNLIEFLYI
jgi:hypothetical protein